MDELIRKIAGLMSEQTAAYASLTTAADQLAAALVRGEPDMIESLTRAGETELRRMRVRLVEIASALTAFAEFRTQEPAPINESTREEFEKSAKMLLESAKNFQKISSKAASLALGGSSFAAACVQMCGVPPMTYNAPVWRHAEGGMR